MTELANKESSAMYTENNTVKKTASPGVSEPVAATLHVDKTSSAMLLV